MIAPGHVSPTAMAILVVVVTLAFWAIMLVMFRVNGRISGRQAMALLVNALVANLGVLLLSSGSFFIGAALAIWAMVDYTYRLNRHAQARP